MNYRNESKKEIIECQCGACMLKVESAVDYYNDNKQYFQEYLFAMFKYGNQKRNIFKRIKIALNYLITGEMFNDQLCLSQEEAMKLANFIIENMIKSEK